MLKTYTKEYKPNAYIHAFKHVWLVMNWEKNKSKHFSLQYYLWIQWSSCVIICFCPVMTGGWFSISISQHPLLSYGALGIWCPQATGERTASSCLFSCDLQCCCLPVLLYSRGGAVLGKDELLIERKSGEIALACPDKGSVLRNLIKQRRASLKSTKTNLANGIYLL